MYCVEIARKRSPVHVGAKIRLSLICAQDTDLGGIKFEGPRRQYIHHDQLLTLLYVLVSTVVLDVIKFPPEYSRISLTSGLACCTRI